MADAWAEEKSHGHAQAVAVAAPTAMAVATATAVATAAAAAVAAVAVAVVLGAHHKHARHLCWGCSFPGYVRILGQSISSMLGYLNNQRLEHVGLSVACASSGPKPPGPKPRLSLRP